MLEESANEEANKEPVFSLEDLNCVRLLEYVLALLKNVAPTRQEFECAKKRLTKHRSRYASIVNTLEGVQRHQVSLRLTELNSVIKKVNVAYDTLMIGEKQKRLQASIDEIDENPVLQEQKPVGFSRSKYIYILARSLATQLAQLKTPPSYVVEFENALDCFLEQHRNAL